MSLILGIVSANAKRMISQWDYEGAAMTEKELSQTGSGYNNDTLHK